MVTFIPTWSAAAKYLYDLVASTNPNRGTMSPSTGLGDRPTCITADSTAGRAWCGTQRGGVYRSDDGGALRVAAGDGYFESDDGGATWRSPGSGRWERVRDGWPDPPNTIAPLLKAGESTGELWSADERGVHRSNDGGASWRIVATYGTTPNNLRGLSAIP